LNIRKTLFLMKWNYQFYWYYYGK